MVVLKCIFLYESTQYQGVIHLSGKYKKKKASKLIEASNFKNKKNLTMKKQR